MIKKPIKDKSRKKIHLLIILVIVIAISLGIYFLESPVITGKVILGKETVHTENLNMEKNESSSYEWTVKNPGDMSSLKASGSISSNGTARVYIENQGKRYLLFDSTKQLFDVNIHVLPEYKKILQGDEVLIQIALFNLRGFGSGNVSVKYSIKDSKEHLIANETESIFVATKAEFVRKLLLPADIKPGTYIAFVEVFTDTVIGTGSDTFEVQSKYEYTYPPELQFYMIGLALIVGLVILILLALYGFGRIRRKRKIAGLREKRPIEKIVKLRKELAALENAYKSQFISKESYEKDKERILREMKKLRG